MADFLIVETTFLIDLEREIAQQQEKAARAKRFLDRLIEGIASASETATGPEAADRSTEKSNSLQGKWLSPFLSCPTRS